jgi:hypothetical protein
MRSYRPKQPDWIKPFKIITNKQDFSQIAL